VKLTVQNARWKGVPFYLRSGKGLRSRYSEVMIQFHCPPHLPFKIPVDASLQCNRLKIIVQPNEGILLNFQTKVPEVDGVSLEPRDLSFNYKDSYKQNPIPEAYERLILDAIQGDASLFMRSDEIERAWAIVDPFVKAAEGIEPEAYAPGTDGPRGAEELLKRTGKGWVSLCG